MTDFRPFCGWHYNGEAIDFEDVLAPPYDIISAPEQEALYQKSAYNCIRLILNKILDTDTDDDNRYTRARDFFTKWREEGILIRDDQPAFYLYEQEFDDPETGERRKRSSLLGRLKLEPFENKVVIPHEKTLSKPRKDRTQLIQQTRANLSPVFGLYESAEGGLAVLYESAKQEKALFRVEDKESIVHSLWIIQDPQRIRAIQEELKTKKVYIADGHHRYQTSLDYGLAQRNEEGVPEGQTIGSDFILMALVEFHDPGLALFATHRLIKTLEHAKDLEYKDPEVVVESLQEFFDIEAVSKDTLEERLRDDPSGKISFGIAFKGHVYYLVLKDVNQAKAKMPSGHADIWYQLDVNIIPHLVLNTLWGIQESDWESTVGYTHSTEEAYTEVREGNAELAFILRAPQVELLRDMGDADELMAQKSTYFYPKLASGLVFHHHDTSQS